MSQKEKQHRKLKVLVLYFRKDIQIRNTIDEHLYSFKSYVKNVNFYYFNALNGIPKYLALVDYDGVILHYTFLSMRWAVRIYKKWEKKCENLRFIKGFKVATPQDEYAETESLCAFFKKYDVKTVFTCFREPDDYLKAYPPEKTGLKQHIPVYAGYVDEKAIEYIKPILQHREKRPIDVGYRARKLPYWLGVFGQLKYRLGKLFNEKAIGSGLCLNISIDSKDVLKGKNWYKFLCKCRTVLGCKSGASMMDLTGEVRSKVEEYVKANPKASFEETEEHCFKGLDNNIRLFTLSPRHFECAMTKTCQILLEGEYYGILNEGVHYIEIKKDFSNLDHVIEQIKDVNYCKEIAENTYRDIVESGLYTYRKFAEQIIDHIREKSATVAKNEKFNNFCVLLLELYLPLRSCGVFIVMLLYSFLCLIKRIIRS